LLRLDNASQTANRQRRQLNQAWRQKLAPLETFVTEADQQILRLKQQRKRLSQQLQIQMHQAYTLSNFAGQSHPLAALTANALPTGTGDCCAPKLLNAAVEQGLRPLAMAEFWWGSSRGDKHAGQFYPACAERCQPIMGFLLSGLGKFIPSKQALPLPILYEDAWLVAVNKPTGMLSVPGRGSAKPANVFSQLQTTLGIQLWPLHRLDEETSGVLLFAKDLDTYRELTRQWQQRQVNKLYIAILAGVLEQTAGLIDLPLWGNPAERPRQSIDFQHGKPSQTKFQVLRQVQGHTWVEFSPVTGRTHQIRVHAAAGLGIPIWGDQFYGCTTPAPRLYLHAQSLNVWHPHQQKDLYLQIESPF
jgi:tRNA pseudouridine32 synthase/23S rRNA pseudouridine746 synthase